MFGGEFSEGLIRQTWSGLCRSIEEWYPLLCRGLSSAEILLQPSTIWWKWHLYVRLNFCRVNYSLKNQTLRPPNIYLPGQNWCQSLLWGRKGSMFCTAVIHVTHSLLCHVSDISARDEDGVGPAFYIPLITFLWWKQHFFPAASPPPLGYPEGRTQQSMKLRCLFYCWSQLSTL